MKRIIVALAGLALGFCPLLAQSTDSLGFWKEVPVDYAMVDTVAVDTVVAVDSDSTDNSQPIKMGLVINRTKPLELIDAAYVPHQDFSLIAPDGSLEVGSFFDNTEFGGCKVQNDQTMAGVRLTPELGVVVNVRHYNGYRSSVVGRHRIRFGVAVQQNFGESSDSLTYDFLAYYNFKYENKYSQTFYMGAFPLKEAIGEYPRMFFQDSISFYRPVAQGFSYLLTSNGLYRDNTLHLWLNWTGKQADSVRESFFIGWSAKVYHFNSSSVSPFFFEHLGYMFHYAKTKNAPDNQYIHDNLLTLTRFGVDLDRRFYNWHLLNASVGYVAGIEDDRGNTDWLLHSAMLAEVNVGWHGWLELSNSLYVGQKQMRFYNQETNHLYWGDPIYRSTFYNRSDLAFNFLHARGMLGNVDLKLVFTLHALSQGLYVEQGLYASMKLGK